MARILENTFIDGPAGRLEALIEGPDDDVEIVRAVVAGHPHPLYGGTMHNKVVFRLARAARRAGAVVLRFNFRGVGRSAGTHDAGRGEQDDVRAAMSFVQDRHPGLPLVLTGFSFGASMALKVACSDPRVERVAAAGTPVDRATFGFLNECACPKRFIQSTHDEFGSRKRMEEVFAAAAEPKSLQWVEAEDHFFAGGLDEFEEAARTAIAGD